MRSRTWPVGLLLCGSGFCALVYQIGWLREFRLIFGASTAASAAVLAIFIGGLGVGSLLLGPRADAQRRPLLFYSNLEAAIAVCAAVSPWLLSLVRTLYIASGGAARLGMTVATGGRLVLSALVLAVPTMAMGGTLPAAARAVTRSGDARRQDVALLYAMNTLGAVAGCLVATFWMMEVFGTRRTLWLAAAINVLVALVARQMDQTWAGEAGRAGESGGPGTVDLPEIDPAIPAPPAPPAFIATAAATVGFAFFLLELIWYRLLAPLLGGSVFTFGLVLAVALAGIGLGGLAYSMVSADRRATLGGFAVSSLLEGAAVAATYALGDRVATLALALTPLQSVGFLAHTAGWAIITIVLVLPPALIAGYQFPLLIALFGRGRERVGSHVGIAYAANTAGAIAGSLAGGFGVLPWLTAPVAWKLVAVVLALLGVAAVALERGSKRIAPLALAAVTIALLFASGPTAAWRHSGIGAGRAGDTVFATPNAYRAWEYANRRKIEWEGDGVESSVALALDDTGHTFVVNGKSDGSARGDAGTQVMLGLLGVLRQPQPKRAFVIGLGTGSTAGWLAAVPTMERVDVVELEPLVLDVARACAAVNHDAMNNPKLHVVIGDARETLLTTTERYDVIASEPSNPYRAGIASLFTQEYYRAASDRLTPDGVFAQWVQAYEIDAETLRTIYDTLHSVFPYIETWQTNGGDLTLLGMHHPASYDAAALAARIRQEPVRSALANVWRVVDLNGLFAHFIANDRFARDLAASPGTAINTDDQNLVEFGLARSVGRARGSLVPDIRRDARAHDAWRPPIDTDRDIQWPAVDTEWLLLSGFNPATLSAVAPGTTDEQGRRSALQRYFNTGDVAGARDVWRHQTEPARNPSELLLAADAEAEAGSDAAPSLIDRLRSYEPFEADVVLAQWHLQRGQLDPAAAALESAFLRLRTDPWPLLSMKERALRLANAIASRQPPLARRLSAALSQPFALAAVSDKRLLTLLNLAHLDLATMCVAPASQLEPNFVWAEDALRWRYDCYDAAHDPRASIALRDLREFFSHEPQPLITR